MFWLPLLLFIGFAVPALANEFIEWLPVQIGAVALGLIFLLVPATSAGSLPRELELKSFDLLRSTLLSPHQIVGGKFLGSVYGGAGIVALATGAPLFFSLITGYAPGLVAACANPKDVAACVVYYGGHPTVEYDFDRLTAPVLGHWAEDDDFAGANVPRFEAELGRRGKPFEFHVYPGTKHAFFNDDRPEVYDRDAAVRSWERTIDHLTKCL